MTPNLLLAMAWLAAHPGSDANTLGRIVTDRGTPRQVSGIGHHIALDLCRFGYAKAARTKGCKKSRLRYTLTRQGKRLLKAP